MYNFYKGAIYIWSINKNDDPGLCDVSWPDAASPTACNTYIEIHHVLLYHQVTQLLTTVSEALSKKVDPLHAMLQTRFNLYGTPLERELFDTEPPLLTKQSVSVQRIREEGGEVNSSDRLTLLFPASWCKCWPSTSHHPPLRQSFPLSISYFLGIKLYKEEISRLKYNWIWLLF